MSGQSRKPSCPTGLEPAGRRVWRDVVSALTVEPWELPVLAEAARAADSAARLTAKATAHKTSATERRLCEDAAGRQRLIVARLLHQIAPPPPAATAQPAAPASQPTRLRGTR